MKLTKKAQYAVLFGLYLARAGRANVATVAATIGTSTMFLEQVARSLRIAGLIRSVRGPGGGYELEGNPLVFDFLNALGMDPMLSEDETKKYAFGSFEERAFAGLIGEAASSAYRELNKPIRDLACAHAGKEGALLDSANEARVN